jgi:hypothetical protein
MEKSKNDKSSQQSDSKSNQQTPKDGNRKETNPNNPTANQGKPKGSTHESNYEETAEQSTSTKQIKTPTKNSQKSAK